MKSRWFRGFKAPCCHLLVISLLTLILCVASEDQDISDNGSNSYSRHLQESRFLALQPGNTSTSSTSPKLTLHHEDYLASTVTSTSSPPPCEDLPWLAACIHLINPTIGSGSFVKVSSPRAATVGAGAGPAATPPCTTNYSMKLSTSGPVDSFQPFDEQLTRTINDIRKPLQKAQTLLKKPAEQLQHSMHDAGEFIRKPEVYAPAVFVGGTLTAGAITAAVLNDALQRKTSTTITTSTTSTTITRLQEYGHGRFIMARMSVGNMNFSAGLNSISTTNRLVATEDKIPEERKVILELGGFWIGVGYCSTLMAIGFAAWICCPRKKTWRTVAQTDYSDDDVEDQDNEEEDDELYPLE